jgi:MFS family permease
VGFFCLAASGAADAVSTVVRQTLRQLLTPDALRGRMTAVNMIFFIGGPQLGEVEAGLVARAFGARLSVVSGGLLCLGAALVAALAVPSLRVAEWSSPSDDIDQNAPPTDPVGNLGKSNH